jgi:hypothetical protein
MKGYEMPRFTVTEYFLNPEPPIKRKTIVDAVDAVSAIRSTEHWRYASQFTMRDCNTFNKNRKSQAHTQDANGMSGCEAVK